MRASGIATPREEVVEVLAVTNVIAVQRASSA